MNEPNQIELMEEVERIVKGHRMNYFDALLYYCEKKNIDFDNINKLIPSSLKTKLEESAIEMKLLKKKFIGKTLPV